MPSNTNNTSEKKLTTDLYEIADYVGEIQSENMDGVEFYAYPPAHIDREAWTAEWIKRDGYTECSKCEHWYDSPVSEEEGDRPAFCPGCGRAMTPEARAELNKRLRG